VPELEPQDQEKVDQYLAREGGDERKAFSPMLCFAGLIVVLIVLTVASYVIALNHGVV